MKIKIIHVSKDLVGGIGTVILSLLKNFNNYQFSSKSLILDSSIKNNENKILKIITSYFLLKKNIFNNIDCNLLHFHGGFTPHIILINKFKHKPVLLSPHGALNQISLKKNKHIKIFAKYFYMQKAYQNANCIHALTSQEVADIKKYNIYSVPIAIIPNGINIKKTLFLNKKLKIRLLKLANNKRIILSLSRLHVSKGIDILINAFYKLYKKNKNHILYIVGSGDKKYTLHLQNKIKSLYLYKNIFLLGEMKDNDKNTLYDIADIFVLPSFNEGFGLTVLEAYRQKTPVITTTATPFKEIENIGCGWYVEPTLDGIYLALNNTSLLSKSELQNKGNIGYEWIKNNYSLITIIQMYEELYLWLLGKCDKPKFIIKE